MAITRAFVAVAVLAFVESALNSECAGCELNIPAETCGFDPARPISIVRRMIGRLIEDLADVERDINGEMRHAPKKRAKKAA